ncbi:unnamed protein product [Ixodes persulcatus]
MPLAEAYLNLKRAFQLRGFFVHSNCSYTEERGGRCWLAKDLTNVILCLYNGCMELTETKTTGPGRLSLRHLMGSVVFDGDTAACEVPESYAVVTINLLLRRHRCIECVEFSNEIARSDHFDFVLGGLNYNEEVTRFAVHDLYGIKLDELLDTASRLRNLRELALVDTLLREDVAESFERMLRGNQSIESLELIRNCVENDEFAISACKLLPGLRRFIYDNNLLYDTTVDEVARLMKSETCILEELRITRCFREEWAGTRLATALGENTTVKFLQLKACYVSSDVGAEFARALKKNRCLERLDLSYCQVDGDGLSLLAKALRSHNRTLQRLDLEAISVWPDHCLLLLDAMVENETLTKLNLGYLRERDRILEAIAARGLQHRIHLGLVGVVMEEALYEVNAGRLLSTITSLTVNFMGVHATAMYSKMLFRFASISKVLKVLKVNLMPLVYADTCNV